MKCLYEPIRSHQPESISLSTVNLVEFFSFDYLSFKYSFHEMTNLNLMLRVSQTENQKPINGKVNSSTEGKAYAFKTFDSAQELSCF